MSIDLSEHKFFFSGDTVPEETIATTGINAFQLVAMLCRSEARVCLRGEDSNLAELHGAWYDCNNGLIVMDKHGQRFRLRVTAEPFLNQPVV